MKRGNQLLEQRQQQTGMILVYTLIFITVMGLILSQLSSNLKLEQQISFALNQQSKLTNTLKNYSRQLPFTITKNFNWPQLAGIQRISPLASIDNKIDAKGSLSCNDSQHYLLEVVEAQTRVKAPVAATFLENNNEEHPSYLLAVLMCVSNSYVQFWLSELVLLQYFQNGTVSRLYTEQFQQLKG